MRHIRRGLHHPRTCSRCPEGQTETFGLESPAHSSFGEHPYLEGDNPSWTWSDHRRVPERLGPGPWSSPSLDYRHYIERDWRETGRTREEDGTSAVAKTRPETGFDKGHRSSPASEAPRRDGTAVSQP